MMYTHDSISLRGAGIVSVTQPRRGVRFTQDSLLLADFCRLRSRDTVFEPGAGTGVITLLLAKKFPRARFIADELDPLAYALLCRNIGDNGVAGRVAAVNADIRDLAGAIAPSSLDVVVANPPYVARGAGRSSPGAERRRARQDEDGALDAWIALSRLLKNGGRYVLVFPAHRSAELVSSLHKRRLEPKRFRYVHPRRESPASLVLIEAMKQACPGARIEPPLVLHEKEGRSKELDEMYG